MTRSSAAAALVALTALTGCASLEAGRVGREVARDLESRGARVEGGFAIAGGRGLIGTGRFLGRLLAPTSTAEARLLTRHVRGLKVAVFSVEGVSDVAGLARPRALDRYRAADGWYALAAVRDSAGASWVLVREDGDVLRDLLALVVSPEGIVVTKLSGDLTELVLDAVALGSPSGLVDDVLFLEGDGGDPNEGDPDASHDGPPPRPAPSRTAPGG